MKAVMPPARHDTASIHPTPRRTNSGSNNTTTSELYDPWGSNEYTEWTEPTASRNGAWQQKVDPWSGSQWTNGKTATQATRTVRLGSPERPIPIHEDQQQREDQRDQEIKKKKRGGFLNIFVSVLDMREC